jgi:hypothetical protein
MSGGTGGLLLVSLNWIVPVPVVMWINNHKHWWLLLWNWPFGESNFKFIKPNKTTIVPLPFPQQIVN